MPKTCNIGVKNCLNDRVSVQKLAVAQARSPLSSQQSQAHASESGEHIWEQRVDEKHKPLSEDNLEGAENEPTADEQHTKGKWSNYIDATLKVTGFIEQQDSNVDRQTNEYKGSTWELYIESKSQWQRTHSGQYKDLEKLEKLHWYSKWQLVVWLDD